MHTKAWRALRKAGVRAVLAVLCFGCLPLGAARAGAVALTASFHSPASPTERIWEFPYSDEYFDHPAAEYCLERARAPLGRAVSAFRSPSLPPERQGENVRSYLTQAGFEALQSDGYDQQPASDSLSTMIGQKRIGDVTIVAVAVCGANYEDEWLGNFAIGDETRHRGFDAAAKLAEARIRAYLNTQGVAGPVKLWISGYSRAAAVSNLTAADMTDSGLFAGVYAYTFATPRATREPGSYANIFNILGKFDPVPAVPMAEWGYERCGVDLYTPAQETDSDYRQKKAAASAVSERLTGMPFWNSVEMNNNLHTILDYLYELLPTAALYDAKMQAILETVWKDRSLPNLSAVFVQLMEDEELLTEANKYEMEYLLDYLSMTTYTTVTGQTGWNAKTTMLENLAHEHSPDVYVAWMFSSDDPKRIFTEAMDYVRLTYKGHVRISLCGETGFYLTINADGSTSDWSDVEGYMDTAPPLEQRPLISAERKGTQTVLTLPKDAVYALLLEPLQAETLSYFATAYRVGRMRGELGEISYTDMELDQVYSAVSLRHEMDAEDADGKPVYGDDDFSFSPWSEELPYSTSVLSQLENENVFHLTWTQLAWLAGGLAALTLIMLTLIVVMLIKRRRRKRATAVNKGE